MFIIDDNYAILESLDNIDDLTRLLEKHISPNDTMTLAVACNGPILSDRQRTLVPRLNNARRARLLHRIENRVAELQPAQLAPQIHVFTPMPFQHNQSRQLQLTSSPRSPPAATAASSASSSPDEYGDLYGMRPRSKGKKSSKKTKKSAKGSKKVKKSVRKSKKSVKKTKKRV